MAIALTYGSYTHADNEAEVSIMRAAVMGERGVRKGTKETWKIRGILQAADASALSTAISALEAAYAVDGGNLSLSGTPHSLASNDCYGGTVVTAGPNYPNSKGGEGSTWRTYEIEVSGEVQDDDWTFDSWTETISFSGGGPQWVMIPTRKGPPRRQQVSEQTPYRASQSGQCVSRRGYASPPPPLWPQHEHTDERNVSRTLPEFKAKDPQNYTTSWSYSFESAAPLGGVPTPPPAL